MPLQLQDRIFLADYVQFNWMHRFLAAQALVHVGANPGPFAIRELRLCFPGRSVDELSRLSKEANEPARIQAVIVPRILAECVAALEDTGAFARAIGRWATPRGVLASNFDYSVSDIREFYDSVLQRRRTHLPTLLNLPPLGQLRARRDTPLYKDLQTNYPGIGRRLRQAARSYRKVGKSRIFKLNTGRLRPNWRDMVHVLVDIRATDVPAPPRPGGIFDRTYNKVKHGFNVLESIEQYAKLPRKPDSLWVVKLGRQWGHVKKLVDEIGKLGILSNRLATLVSLLDDQGLLP